MKSKPIIGILIILTGVVFLISEIFSFNSIDVFFDWWPLLIVIYGISQLNKRNDIKTPVIIIIIGLFLLLHSLDILMGNLLRNLIALILILAGIQILSNNRKSKKLHINSKDGLSINSIFSGTHHIEENKDFKSGNIFTLFGGAEVDLRNAEIQDEAFLDISCAFGGVELKVPEEWEIRTGGTPFFGGFENKTIQKNNKEIIRPVLNITYSAMFGGISMKN